MRRVTISESTGGRYFWEEGDDTSEIDLGDVADAVEALLIDREKFTITYG